MENASKALLIAAGVLMAIVVVAIGVTLFVNYRRIAEGYDATMSTQQIAKINDQFERYKGRTDIKIQEVVAAAKTANSYNEKYGIDDLITVKIGTIKFSGKKEIPDNKTKEYYIEYIKTRTENNKTYSINSISYYDDSDDLNYGLIKEIKFQEH